MKPSSAIARVLLASSLALGAAAPAVAQTAGQGQQEQVKTDWSDQKLDAFAAASVAINEMQSEWQKRLAEADSREKQAELRKKASDAAMQTIKDEGLSPKEYNRIYEAAQQDEDLYDDVMGRIQNARSG